MWDKKKNGEGRSFEIVSCDEARAGDGFVGEGGDREDVTGLGHVEELAAAIAHGPDAHARGHAFDEVVEDQGDRFLVAEERVGFVFDFFFQLLLRAQDVRDELLGSDHLVEGELVPHDQDREEPDAEAGLFGRCQADAFRRAERVARDQVAKRESVRRFAVEEQGHGPVYKERFVESFYFFHVSLQFRR